MYARRPPDSTCTQTTITPNQESYEKLLQFHFAEHPAGKLRKLLIYLSHNKLVKSIYGNCGPRSVFASLSVFRSGCVFQQWPLGYTAIYLGATVSHSTAYTICTCFTCPVSERLLSLFGSPFYLSPKSPPIYPYNLSNWHLTLI